MKEIFIAIQARLKAQVAALRWIDFDLGQLDQATPPVSFPCALIAFTKGQYEVAGQNTTIGILTVEIAVAFRLYERTHSAADEGFQANALEHMDTVDAVRVALEGFSGTGFEALSFSEFNMDRRADLRVWRLRFTASHYPAAPESPEVPWPGPSAVGFCVHPEIN